MSGFNTKQCNNDGEYEITFYTDNHEEFKAVEAFCINLIGHGKPIPKGDLISREALKADLRQYFTDGVLDGISAKLAFAQIIRDIDNAPSPVVDCKKCDGYEVGYQAGVKDSERQKDKDEFSCEHCKYKSKPAHEEPCSICKHAHDSMFEWDE